MSEKPLIDRMGDAFTNMLASALPEMNWTDETGQLILREAREVLAEYRNRPPEISQATARAGYILAMRLLQSGLSLDSEEEAAIETFVPRAEVELKGEATK